MKSIITIFTDGSSRGNPGPGGWGAVLIFSENQNSKLQVESEKLKVKEIGGREENTTNNRMELIAVIKAFEFLSTLHFPLSTINLYSDSSYVIKGISSWIKGWKANDWKTKDKKDVLNKDLWQQLDEVSSGFKVSWNQLSGHVGILGNERCDEIATGFATGEIPKLFEGEISEYKIPILDFKIDQGKFDEKKKKSAQAYSYVSKVDGEIKIHKTWKECEERVKGKTGARFKKSFSKDNENEIVEDFSK